MRVHPRDTELGLSKPRIFESIWLWASVSETTRTEDIVDVGRWLACAPDPAQVDELMFLIDGTVGILNSGEEAFADDMIIELEAISRVLKGWHREVNASMDSALLIEVFKDRPWYLRLWERVRYGRPYSS